MGQTTMQEKKEKDNCFETLHCELDNSTGNIILMGVLKGRVGKNTIGIERYLELHKEDAKNYNGGDYYELRMTLS